jgi:hypothetical protein
MTSFNLYEAYAAVYNEDLREDVLTVEEDLSFVDDLSDNELVQIMEEILSEKEVTLDECFDVFDAELLSEETEMQRMNRLQNKATREKKSAAATAGRMKSAERERVGRKHAVKRLQVATTRAGKNLADKAKTGAEKVKGKLASAKEKLKGFIKSGRKAVAGGLRGLASKVEPKETSKTRESKPYRGEGSGRKETVGKQVKDAAKEKIKAASSDSVSSGSKVKALPPVGKTKTGKTLTSSQRATQTAAQNRRLASRLGEDLELLTDLIIEDLINKGYAETLEEAFTVLESMSDYAVGDIAESYLTEETETTDLYDVVLEHLLDEGYADTEDAATVIMANMSEEWREEIIEAMSNYERNRQRAAQRAAARNEARKQGKTGNVPGVGYVSPRKERETWRDESGQERHTSGARMPKKD